MKPENPISNPPGHSQDEIDRLTSEIAEKNRIIAELATATAPHVAQPALEPSPDEPVIRQKMEKGLTRQQAVDVVARQRHYDAHVAPKRRQFAINSRSRPMTVNRQ